MHITKGEYPIDIDIQSIEIPDSGGIKQSTLTPIGIASEYLYSDVKTVVDVLQKGCELSKNGPCLGWRDSNSEYRWLTYEKVIQRSRDVSSGLISSGMKRGQETFVGIYAQNCVEWVLVEHACYCQSCVTVPLYETLGADAITFILNHVEAEIVVCDTEQKVNSLLDARNETPNLKQIIAMHGMSEEVKKRAVEKGIILHQLNDIEELGKRKPESLKLPDPSDLATVCYTSGTTGNPKGVMITHRNLVVDASAFIIHIGFNYIGVGDRHISYLPLAHVFDRIYHVIHLLSGSSIGFFRGDIKYLLDDICALKPTILIAVPRVLNRVYDKVQKQVNSSKIKKFLLKAAMQAKEAELKRGLMRNDFVWDFLVLKKVRKALGGKVRMIITGGAPVRDDVLLFFRCCFGCPVLQIYGQTETGGPATTNIIGDYVSGTVGPPMPCCLMRLIDVPEMNYYAKNGGGEVLIKGPNNTKGYFKDPIQTAELLDQEGWIHTGDIGRWTKNGSLAIIDRKKHILKLSQGEYIAPEKVESIYLASPYVEQIFVYGESLENCLVGIVVPAKEELLSWCSQSGVEGDYDKICQNKVVREHVLEHLLQLGQEAGLKGFEQVKALHLHPHAFTMENGILTATMKTKRTECHKQFKDIIRKMYKDLSEREKRSNIFT